MSFIKFLLISASIIAGTCSCAKLPPDETLMSCKWSVQMESQADPSKVVNMDSDEFNCEIVAPGEFRYTHDDAEVTVKWTFDKKGLQVTPSVKFLKDGWVFTSMIGPLVPIQTRIEEHNLIMPVGFGEKFTKTPADSAAYLKADGSTGGCWKKAGKYFEVVTAGKAPVVPSRYQTMQWCAFAGAQDGIYMASHDPEFSYKQFVVRYYPAEDTYRFCLRSHHVLFEGESCTLPTFMVKNYKGDWHAAADIYRDWFRTVKTGVQSPEWMKKSTGWLLTILKQQNDEIIWPYKDLRGELADVAIARGIDIIGLFGWTAGGHDRWYPEYDICPKMGGEEELRESLKVLHEKGLYSIIYVNGQLQDMDGTKHWWEETGKNITVVEKDGSYDFETWHKYSDAPARKHGRPCHSTKQWRDKMLELAKMANDLGADGIIYDQLGTRGPQLCYSPNHGHKVPAIVYETDRRSNLDYVRSEMAKINPEFIVSTEGTQDVELSAIDFFHGCTYGVYDPNQKYQDAKIAGSKPFETFPEMLKYTLPEMECTVRHPSPVADRMLLNYETVYGFRHEIETRYAADRRYLLEDRIPELDDYGTVRSKPNIKMMQTQDAVAMRLYSKQVLDLKRKYSDCLLEGTFRDNLGITLQSDSPYVISKVFESKDGKRSAVVVWNCSEDKIADCTVSLSGRRLVSSDSPEAPVQGTELQPQSMRVMIFEK